LGSSDDQNAKYVLEIDHVLRKVTIYSNTYAGGVLGSHNKGVGRIKIEHCIFTGELYYGQSKSEPLTSSLKNCSGIVGRYQANAIAEVRDCYAYFEDNNTNFDVDGSRLIFGAITLKSLYTQNLDFSEDNWEFKVNPENETRLLEPYAVLKFLGNWD
ncbi:MAG: hypothetical protein K2N47_01430, partial [Clostridia bacterium]|nr:hypothetical protein [Clostridia bacterium]